VTNYASANEVYEVDTVMTATAGTTVTYACLVDDQGGADDYWLQALFNPAVSLNNTDTLTITWQVTFS
jgi:hypothetical protein